MNHELPDTEDNDINVERTQCHFCGHNSQPIHPDSDAQYGEPVCTLCYVKSYVRDSDGELSEDGFTYDGIHFADESPFEGLTLTDVRTGLSIHLELHHLEALRAVLNHRR